MFRSDSTRVAYLIGVVCLVQFGIGGCGRPSGYSVVSAEDGFPTVVNRLQAEAQAKSVHGAVITVAPSTDGPDGRRIVSARRVKGDTTTAYTLQFKFASGGWVCCEAEAAETGPGGECSTHRLTSNATGLDHLMIWLGW